MHRFNEDCDHKKKSLAGESAWRRNPAKDVLEPRIEKVATILRDGRLRHDRPSKAAGRSPPQTHRSTDVLGLSRSPAQSSVGVRRDPWDGDQMTPTSPTTLTAGIQSLQLSSSLRCPRARWHFRRVPFLSFSSLSLPLFHWPCRLSQLQTAVDHVSKRTARRYLRL